MPTRWTDQSIASAIEAHLEVRYTAEDRLSEAYEEMKALKAEIAQLEAVCDRHARAQCRLVEVRLRMRKAA